jgi:hypothetical protein
MSLRLVRFVAKIDKLGHNLCHSTELISLGHMTGTQLMSISHLTYVQSDITSVSQIVYVR